MSSNTLIFHSRQAMFCSSYAVKHPDRVEHLVLVSPAGVGHPPPPGRLSLGIRLFRFVWNFRLTPMVRKDLTNLLRRLSSSHLLLHSTTIMHWLFHAERCAIRRSARPSVRPAACVIAHERHASHERHPPRSHPRQERRQLLVPQLGTAEVGRDRHALPPPTGTSSPSLLSTRPQNLRLLLYRERSRESHCARS